MEICHYQTHVCILLIYLVSSFHLTLLFFSLFSPVADRDYLLFLWNWCFCLHESTAGWITFIYVIVSHKITVRRLKRLDSNCRTSYPALHRSLFFHQEDLDLKTAEPWPTKIQSSLITSFQLLTKLFKGVCVSSFYLCTQFKERAPVVKSVWICFVRCELGMEDSELDFFKVGNPR